MNLLQRIRRYFALSTYGARQGWRRFKNDALELWHYWCFVLEYRLHRAWPLRVLAWLLSKRTKKSQEFGKFREKEVVMQLPADHSSFAPLNDRIFTIEAASKAFEHVKVVGSGVDEIEPLTPEQHAAIAIHQPIVRGKVVDSVLTDHGLHHASAIDQVHGQTSSRSFLNKCGAEAGNPCDEATSDDAADELICAKATEAQSMERWKTRLAVAASVAGAAGFLVAMAALIFAR